MVPPEDLEVPVRPRDRAHEDDDARPDVPERREVVQEVAGGVLVPQAPDGLELEGRDRPRHHAVDHSVLGLLLPPVYFVGLRGGGVGVDGCRNTTRTEDGYLSRRPPKN